MALDDCSPGVRCGRSPVRRAAARPLGALGSATKLPVCWPSSRVAALPRTKIATAVSRARSVPRPPGTARALVHALSLASFAALLVAPARCEGQRAPQGRGRRSTDDRRAARNSCHASAAARDSCCPPYFGGWYTELPIRAPPRPYATGAPHKSINHGLALRRDRKKGRELPRLPLRLDEIAPEGGRPRETQEGL